jgi:type IV secretion system protein VirB3
MRTVPIHASLLRPLLLAGGERELVILNAIAAAVLIFGVGGTMGIVMGVVIWTIVQFALVQLAKRDPQFRQIFARQIHQQKVYYAAAHPDARQQLIR